MDDKSGWFDAPVLDISVLFLIISNLITLVIAIVQHWNFATILWVYWIQSVAIGFFTFLKMITLLFPIRRLQADSGYCSTCSMR